MAEFDDAGSPHFHGHRDRLRIRFRDQGAAALADYELLEMAIFRAIQRSDTNPSPRPCSSASGRFPKCSRRRASG